MSGPMLRRTFPPTTAPPRPCADDRGSAHCFRVPRPRKLVSVHSPMHRHQRFPHPTPTPGEGTTTDRGPGPIPADSDSNIAPAQTVPDPAADVSTAGEDSGRDRYLEQVLVGAAAFTAAGMRVRGRPGPFSPRNARISTLPGGRDCRVAVTAYAPGGQSSLRVFDPNHRRKPVLLPDPRRNVVARIRDSGDGAARRSHERQPRWHGHRLRRRRKPGLDNRCPVGLRRQRHSCSDALRDPGRATRSGRRHRRYREPALPDPRRPGGGVGEGPRFCRPATDLETSQIRGPRRDRGRGRRGHRRGWNEQRGWCSERTSVEPTRQPRHGSTDPARHRQRLYRSTSDRRPTQVPTRPLVQRANLRGTHSTTSRWISRRSRILR